MLKPLKVASTAAPSELNSAHEQQGRARAHLSGGQRARARALDLRVDVAVENVVPGRAGAAHGDGADQEEQEVVGIGPRVLGRDGGESSRPPARQQQELPADRTVEPGKAHIRQRPNGGESSCERAWRGVEKTGRRARRAHSALGGILTGGASGSECISTLKASSCRFFAARSASFLSLLNWAAAAQALPRMFETLVDSASRPAICWSSIEHQSLLAFAQASTFAFALAKTVEKRAGRDRIGLLPRQGLNFLDPADTGLEELAPLLTIR